MADYRYMAVVVDENNVKDPEAPVRIIEKDVPRPGIGEALVRIFLRPVSAACISRPRAYELRSLQRHVNNVA